MGPLLPLFWKAVLFSIFLLGNVLKPRKANACYKVIHRCLVGFTYISQTIMTSKLSLFFLVVFELTSGQYIVSFFNMIARHMFNKAYQVTFGCVSVTFKQGLLATVAECEGPLKDTLFRWFKFTLKPPYSGASEHSLSAIWDTSHWNFFVKFGLRTAWDISYDILLSLLKFVNFWRLQGRLSILAKIGCLQKIKVFSMKERRGFDATEGF